MIIVDDDGYEMVVEETEGAPVKEAPVSKEAQESSYYWEYEDQPIPRWSKDQPF